MKTYPQIKEEIIQSFIDKYERFELCERVCKPDYDKLKSFLSSYLDSLVKQTLEGVEVEREDEGGRQSREQVNTWYENNPYNIGFNQAIDQFNQKKEEFIKEKI